MKNFNESLGKSVVRAGGRIDVAASLEALELVLEQAVVSEENATAGVAESVLAVFEDHKGKTLTKPTVVQFAHAKLGTTPETYTANSELIGAYIDRNKDGGLFTITKGKNGGVRLTADMPAPEAK